MSDAIFSTIDFPPTFANLTGLRVPDDRVIDGVDQTELLFGKSVEGAPNTFFYWSDHDHPIRGGNGIRQRKWEYLQGVHIVNAYTEDKERQKVEELYDLDSDIGETTNLAEKYPEKVTELKALMKTNLAGKA